MKTSASIPSLLSRRAFLRGVASGSLLALSPQWLRSQNTGNRGAILYVTDAMEKHAERPPLRWTRAAAGARATIEIDSTREYQTILGFGAALTEASCFLLQNMPVAARSAFFNETYSPSGLNLSVGRSCIGASDYSRSVYSYDDVPEDNNLDHFSLKHDVALHPPHSARDSRDQPLARFLSPALRSLLGWMKTYGTTFRDERPKTFSVLTPIPFGISRNESMLGGWMSKEHLGVYSRYIDNFLKGYALAGAPVQAVTCQNEVATTQNGRMPACRWSPGLEAKFVRDHLGPLLRAQHRETQVWPLDHNYNLYERVASQLQDKQLARYVDGVAWHGYTGTPDQMSILHRMDPDIPFIGLRVARVHRRSCLRAGLGQVGRHLHRCAGKLVPQRHYVEPDARSPGGRPNVGPYTCGGLVTLKDDGSILKSGQCHALRHFSKHLQRDGTRIASTTDAPGLRHLAAKNPDGRFALVMTNPGEARDLRVVHAGWQISLSLSPAMLSLPWRGEGLMTIKRLIPSTCYD